MAESTPGNPDRNPQYRLGCDLSLIPKAADTPPADIKKLLGVDSANPFLRALRIDRGILNAADLAVELTRKVPLQGDALDDLIGGKK